MAIRLRDRTVRSRSLQKAREGGGRVTKKFGNPWNRVSVPVQCQCGLFHLLPVQCQCGHRQCSAVSVLKKLTLAHLYARDQYRPSNSNLGSLTAPHHWCRLNDGGGQGGLGGPIDLDIGSWSLLSRPSLWFRREFSLRFRFFPYFGALQVSRVCPTHYALPHTSFSHTFRCATHFTDPEGMKGWVDLPRWWREMLLQ